MRDQELPAGRALDARVHEVVFGQGSRPDAETEIPRYSTDLAASWDVAAALQRRGYRIEVDNWPGGGACVRLHTLVDGEQAFSGETPAVAVCRAALAVLGER